jgi:hypothetical protein
MKRDMDLMRQLLLRAEASNERRLKVNGAVEAYQVRLMVEEGLVNGVVIGNQKAGLPDDESYILSLTWAGHDFLDASRDEKLWRKAREKFLKPAASWTFSILLEWLKAEIRNKIPSA